jgi:hypothetical protein
MDTQAIIQLIIRELENPWSGRIAWENARKPSGPFEDLTFVLRKTARYYAGIIDITSDGRFPKGNAGEKNDSLCRATF